MDTPTATPPGPVSRWVRDVVRTVAPVLGALLGFLGVWLFVSYLLLTPERREILVPPPQAVLTDSLLRWSHLQPMLRALLLIANTLFGIHSVDRGTHDLFTLNRASRWQRLTKLQLPAARPSMFAGLRISAGLSVIGSLVGDFFFVQGQPGLGTLLSVYIARVDSTDLFAAILLSSLYGIVIFSLFTGLTRLAIGSWYRGSRTARGDGCT